MNTQSFRDLPISPRKRIILFSLLFLAPSFISANRIHSLNKTLKKNTSVCLVHCTAQRENDSSLKIALENPGLPAPASDTAEATYPGGNRAWMFHLIRTLRYPSEALNKKIQGTVMVKFLIDTKGRVKKPEAVAGPGELRKEAIRVIIEGGKWIPATINGEHTESYKLQTVVFKCE